MINEQNDKIIPATESKIIGLEKSKSVENSGNLMETPQTGGKWLKRISMTCIFIFAVFVIVTFIPFLIYLTTQPKLTANTEFEFANSMTTISNSVQKPARRDDCDEMPQRGCPGVNAIWARLEAPP